MRQIYIDLDAVLAAFEYSEAPIDHYLDLETGKVVMVSENMRIELEAIYEEFWNPDSDEDFNLGEVLSHRNLPKWHRDALIQADAVEEYYLSRYIKIPSASSGDGYRDMQAFIQNISDKDLKNQLWQAINGRGAFRNFRETLYTQPQIQTQWYAFEENQLRQRVLNWLASQDIEPTTIFQKSSDSTLESVRSKLIEEALAFVRAACKVNGVERIALIGSITTLKPQPKDVDILVTISEDADLATLAAMARRMRGHVQSFSRSADVFLADVHNNYLGRTCPWRECKPGLRTSCDALHCGQRPYLHDDLNTIRLSTTLIARPPVELWPHIISRIKVPEDVEMGIIAPLKLEG